MSHDLQHIPLVLLEDNVCSYFNDRRSANLLVHPETQLTIEQQQLLGEAGFRRNGSYFYRPYCGQCEQCISIRIPVQQFRASRTQRKLIKRGQQITSKVIERQFHEEHYQLYYRYLEQRHADGDMFPPTPETYQSFLIEHAGSTKLIELRDQQTQALLAVAVTDFLPNALSAVYTFFDPDQPQLSLGSLAVLKQIELAEQLKKPYLYLGFWIPNHQKMSYKTNYSPFQLYVEQTWRQFEPE